jgi:hypothetical protein
MGLIVPILEFLRGPLQIDAGTLFQSRWVRGRGPQWSRLHTRCARFPVVGSVFGARYPAPGVGLAQVPGTRSQVPGTRDAAGQSGNKAVGQ